MKAKVRPQLPSGFKAISGGGGDMWDYKKDKQLIGKLISITEFDSKFKDPGTKKFKKQKKAIIQRKDGSEVTVFESAGTRALFDVKKGKEVCIVFNGLKKIKGRPQPMKDFTVGVR